MGWVPVSDGEPFDHDRFEMLYCDEPGCRVNEFERGRPADESRCPGCSSIGLPVPPRHQ